MLVPFAVLGGASSADAAVDCTAAIGLEAPITGAVAVLGNEQLAFAKLAVQDDNKANGTHISLVQGDTQLSPSLATMITHQLVSDPQVVGVVGPAGSAEVTTVGPLFAAAGMGFISGSATHPMLTNGSNPTFFRVVARDSQQGPEDAGYVIHTLRPNAVMVVDDRSPYSTALARSMIPQLRRAGIRVDHESVSQRQTNFALLVRKVTRPIGVVILPWEIASNAQQFGLQLARAHRRATIVGTDGLFSPGVFTIAGSYVSTFAPDITAIPADANLVARATAAFPKFGTFGPPVYAATHVVDDAIASVCASGETPTRANVLAQIRLTNEPTSVLGQPVRFAANGELEGARWFLFKIDRAHRYRMLTPPAR
jgi:branched-chain amino acid transport system substrate-binding protein